MRDVNVDIDNKVVNKNKTVLQQLKEFDEDRMINKVKKCCEQKIQQILSKEDLSNEDITTLNNLMELYNKCCGRVERNYPYSNTKEDFEALKSAYLGNRVYEQDFITNLLLKVKIIETLLK